MAYFFRLGPRQSEDVSMPMSTAPSDEQTVQNRAVRQGARRTVLCGLLKKFERSSDQGTRSYENIQKYQNYDKLCTQNILYIYINNMYKYTDFLYMILYYLYCTHIYMYIYI